MDHPHLVESFFSSLLSHERERSYRSIMRCSELRDIYKEQGAYDAYERLGNFFVEVRAIFKGEE